MKTAQQCKRSRYSYEHKWREKKIITAIQRDGEYKLDKKDDTKWEIVSVK